MAAFAVATRTSFSAAFRLRHLLNGQMRTSIYQRGGLNSPGLTYHDIICLMKCLQNGINIEYQCQLLSNGFMRRL